MTASLSDLGRVALLVKPGRAWLAIWRATMFVVPFAWDKNTFLLMDVLMILLQIGFLKIRDDNILKRKSQPV